MSWFRKPDYIEYEEGKQYTPAELEIIASQMLREDANTITCHGEQHYDKSKQPIDECNCKPRGIKGDHPILFETHLASRKKREIHCSSGTPDPSIMEGSYWRSHPEGRTVNDPEDRAKRGLGFFK